MKCPFCGSNRGYYQIERVHRALLFDFDGEPIGGSEDVTEEECLNLTFHMFRVEGKELVCIIEGMMELGDRLGMFSPAKEIQEGEEGNRERKRS